MTPPTRSPRRGTAYVFVLATAMLVTVIGMGVLMSAAVGGRTSGNNNDTLRAGAMAESAVEQAETLLNQNPYWRTAYTNNVATTPVAVGGGTISFKLVDESDGNLSNNNTDPVRVYGIGRFGAATRVYSAVLAPSPATPFTCLQVAADSAGIVTFTGNTVTGTATVSSNTSIVATSATLNGTNLEAAITATLTLCSGTGTTTSGITPRTFPIASVFDYYKANGTSVSFGSLPTSSGVATITRALLSPSTNPFGGGTNAKGIYVIDCKGQSVVIADSRIVGTLVLLNAPNVTVQNAEVWEPAITNFPSLLVQGNLTWQSDGTTLKENGTSPVNFNPSGVPLPYNGGASGGTTNTTSTDAFPSSFTGLFYVSGNLTTSNSPSLNGVLVVGGTWTASGSIGLTYAPTFYTTPPQGFATTTLAPVSGSWRWETAP